jgi:hypothetical protein
VALKSLEDQLGTIKGQMLMIRYDVELLPKQTLANYNCQLKGLVMKMIDQMKK